jgi:hypothetical protein
VPYRFAALLHRLTISVPEKKNPRIFLFVIQRLALATKQLVASRSTFNMGTIQPGVGFAFNAKN